MDIQTWQPLSQLAKIRERVSQISHRAGWSPAADWFASEEDLLLVLDAPGLDLSMLELSHDGNTITIEGSRENLDYGERLHGERPLGSFSRVFELPHPVETGSGVAQYRAGQLEVRFRRLGRTIDVG
ncbi:MAG: Hsp20/alpha crystallin family protein [Deinococcales bacterium]